jgi:hypothetical protein
VADDEFAEVVLAGDVPGLQAAAEPSSDKTHGNAFVARPEGFVHARMP